MDLIRNVWLWIVARGFLELAYLAIVIVSVLEFQTSPKTLVTASAHAPSWDAIMFMVSLLLVHCLRFIPASLKYCLDDV